MPEKITLAAPVAEDGLPVFNLIKACPPLDQNSVYCNLLQCHHFSDTSVIAKSGEEVVGFVSGYLIPGITNRLFLWQVAVSEQARGHGLALQMIKHILERGSCQDVDFIETTITEANKASWALFERLAATLACPLSSEVLFDQSKHFCGQHDTEMLVQIGPFDVSGSSDRPSS